MPGLLDLPVELRLRIYESLPRTWLFADVRVGDPCWLFTPTIADHLEYAFDPAILRVNKKISAEAKSVLYGQNTFFFELAGSDPMLPYDWLTDWSAFYHLRNVNIQLREDGGEGILASDAVVLRGRLEGLCTILCKASALRHVTIAVYDWRRFEDAGETSDVFAKSLKKRRDEWQSILEPLASLPETLTFNLDKPIWAACNLKEKGRRIVADAIGSCVEDVMGNRGKAEEAKEL